jgi:predicted hotdog family 3-hydroxylacyl-ACP dehydratase
MTNAEMNMRNSLPPIEELLPHRGTMLLLDRLIEFENDSTIAEYAPRGDAWYADVDGRMPSWIGIELMAQTVAAHVCLVKRSAGLMPKHGVLLGTRRYNSSLSSFSTDKTLRIQVTMIFSDISGLGAYNCSISSDTEELATATLKVFEPDNFQTYIQGSAS